MEQAESGGGGREGRFLKKRRKTSFPEEGGNDERVVRNRRDGQDERENGATAVGQCHQPGKAQVQTSTGRKVRTAGQSWVLRGPRRRLTFVGNEGRGAG